MSNGLPGLNSIVDQKKDEGKNKADKVKGILELNSEKNFVKRIIDPVSYPVIENEDGSISTHRMASGEADGRHFVYPTIIQDKKGSLRQLNDDEAWNHAMDTGEFIEFGDEIEARNFAEGDYKMSSSLFYKE